MALFPYKAAMQLSLLCVSFTLFSAETSTQEARFLKRMKEYWKEGDFDTAKKQIRSYLEQNQASNLNEEMHLLLGDLYLKEGNFLSALDEYTQITKEELKEKVFYNKVLCFYETDNVGQLAAISKTFSSKDSLTLEQKNSVRYLCASSLFEHYMNSQAKDPIVLEKSKELFESCAGTSFENLSLYPLARLHEISGNKKLSASYYEAASQFHPDLTTAFLFQAAMLRSEEAPHLAISTFEQIFSVPSSQQSEALYNCLTLQYKTKQFKELASVYESNHHLLSEEHEEIARELFGKSLYHLGEFEKAIDPLLDTLNQSKVLASQRTAQLMLLECACKIQNVELYHKMFRNPSYPLVNDENYPKAHLVYLGLLKSNERYPEFIEESKVFADQNPNSPDREQVLWDTSHFLYQSKNWKEADRLFAAFIKDYPSSKSVSNALRLQLNCALFEVQTGPESSASASRQVLIGKIREILPKENVLTDAEKETFSFELAKNLFLEEKFEEALSASQTLIEQTPQTRFMEEIETLQTLCYLSHPKYLSQFIDHAEKLLEKSPNFAEADKLRLHLFNAYVQKAEGVPPQERELPLHRAADHLYVLLEKNSSSLKAENILWLGEHYYGLSQKLQEDPLSPQNLKTCYLERSIHAFDALLPAEGSSIEGATELSLLRLSTLFSLSNQAEKKAIYLSRFLNTGESIQSPIQRELLRELAKTHETLGNPLKALDLYNTLIQNHPGSSVRALAILDRSKLLSSYLPKDQQTEENLSYAQNLNDLKDLEVQRSLLSEPLHLEAGLEYISWKSSLGREDLAQKQKKIQLLNLFKENFASELLEESSDPSLKDKEHILASYLKFADAEILRLEASLIETPDEAEAVKRSALSKLEELLLQTSLPEELKTRIEMSQQSLGNNL